MPQRIDGGYTRIEGRVTSDPASPQGWTVASGELPLTEPPVTVAPAVAWSVSLTYAGGAPETVTEAPAAVWSVTLAYVSEAPEAVAVVPAAAWSVALSYVADTPEAVTETPAAVWSIALAWDAPAPVVFTETPSAAWGLSLVFTGATPQTESLTVFSSADSFASDLFSVAVRQAQRSVAVASAVRPVSHSSKAVSAGSGAGSYGVGTNED